MKYEDINKRIEELLNSDFTMDSIREVGYLYQIINSTYARLASTKALDAKTNYVNIMLKLDDVVFSKLKEKLGFEDEVIREILSLAPFFSKVLDIFVIDGNVIVKLLSPDNNREVSHLITKGFYEVADREFSRDLDYKFYKEFFTDAMNNAMVPLFKEKLGKGKILNINEKRIGYNLDDLNIYINKSLKEIMQINTDVTKEVAKVLIKYHNDEIYYYDLKIHYAYLELAHNDYKVNRLSMMLGEKVKVKKR